ncbi:DUF1934 domain-containing protein [Heyndrickxia ginsengihumi]|uniref:DUF1934 family protein n=1 Tax=Heyndrickxia ginsengihumi TaxID=363870 RepID=A0A0A6VEP0_9BACI|nr:DUF1934 domain-containing protein [Heyndrickxia ginsengihumi]KHD86725.1 hypothetical protein NG54_01285 [Heyndrickxia ginsengihumi]MBE6183984.1 DUF1934 domain-containing protein [Bacillus sp. (in: firmicutes)]MCM3022194.1 DUF1934 domain-containing protein [Heyndrickxia ginsengihumi]NEY18426.1 DUF1934 family protein [Heyndrickxia ginsengihumi]
MAVEVQSYPVKIHLKTEIQQEEHETIELILFGRYYEKGNAAFLKYDEVLEEGTVHTIIKIAEDGALILRSGALKMRLSLQTNEQRNGSYESQFGTFLLQTKAKEICHQQMRENNGAISLKYELHMQAKTVGTYNMTIKYEEAHDIT